MAISSFGAILQRAVESTPGAIGGAFADSQGEMIDSFAVCDPNHWALVTAHYGVVMALVRSAFGTWHFGGPEFFVAQHRALDVVVHMVEGGYFALLAVENGPFGIALERMHQIAAELRTEMS